MTPQTDTYDRIVQAARDLIYARSYADVGVAAICEQANVKKGSFYHFFPSKQELTLAVLDTFFTEMKTGLLEKAFRPELAPMERLEQLATLTYDFQSHMKTLTGHVLGCPFGNLASELATQDEAIRHKVAVIFAKMQSAFEETLQQAVARGDISAINVPDTAQAMLAYFEGTILVAKTRNEPELLRQLLPAMTQIRIPAQH